MLPILLLATAGFTVLTTEFMIVGLLPAIARDLAISVAQAGLLITLFAFTVALTGPFLTALFGRADRKTLFVGILVLFGVSNVLAAFSTDIRIMAIARLLPAFALPVFWSLASATAVDLTGPARAGKAISLVTMGIVCATVFGIPIGTLIGDALGWRSAFGILAAIAFAKAGMLQLFFPRVEARTEKVSVLQQMKVLRDPVMAGHIALSMVLFTGMFTVYTYLATMLEKIAGFGGSLVGWTLMAFGTIGLLGNTVGGKVADWNPLGGSLIFASLMAAGMFALVPSFGSGWSMSGTLGIWGVAQAALFTVSAVRVMKAAPSAPAFAASLNISAANIGIGVGAIVGGRVIVAFGVDKLGLVGAGIIGAAVALTVALMMAEKRRRPASAIPVSCSA